MPSIVLSILALVVSVLAIGGVRLPRRRVHLKGADDAMRRLAELSGTVIRDAERKRIEVIVRDVIDQSRANDGPKSIVNEHATHSTTAADIEPSASSAASVGLGTATSSIGV